MMRSIVGLSLRFRLIVVALAVALMFLGGERLRDMPVDVFPEFAPPRVEIQTLSWGLSADEVESLVTLFVLPVLYLRFSPRPEPAGEPWLGGVTPATADLGREAN